MKQILFIGSIDFPFNTANSNFIRRLFAPIVELGCFVELFLVRGAVDTASKKKRKRYNVYNGIKYRYCSFKSKPPNFFLKFVEIIIGMTVSSWLFFLRILQRKVDFVIIYTGYPYLNLPIVILAKIFKKKIVKISVDWYVKKQVVSKLYYLPKWWFFLIEIIYLDRLLNGVIVLNRKLQDHYKQIGVTNTLLVPSVIDVQEFKHISTSKQGITTIGYCGAAPLLNGVDDLIYAFKKISIKYENVRLLIIGDKVGRGSELGLLKRIAKEQGVDSKIKFTGRISSVDVPTWLASCDILILPRKRSVFADFGFPTKLGEYFAMMKTVILTRVGDFEYYFKDGEQVVFCEPDNPNSIVKALDFVLEDKGRAKGIAKKGYSWVVENLDSRQTASRVISFLESL